MTEDEFVERTARILSLNTALDTWDSKDLAREIWEEVLPAEASVVQSQVSEIVKFDLASGKSADQIASAICLHLRLRGIAVTV